MNWDTFWTAAICIVAIAFCAGIYREMVGRDLSRRGKPFAVRLDNPSHKA